MQRRWQLVWFMLLFFVIGISSARAALVEYNLVVEPDFTHCDLCHGGSGTYAITSSLQVPLPEITLAPGDLFRVTLEFANGQFLKRVLPPKSAFHELEIELFLTRNGQEYGAAAEGVDGSSLVQVFNEHSQLALEEASQSVHFVVPRDEELQYTRMWLLDYLYPGEAIGPTVQSLLFELQVPTSFKGYDFSFPYQTTTFAGNWIDISYALYQYDSPPSSNVAVYVVPEPGTLWLAGLAFIATSRRQTDRARC